MEESLAVSSTTAASAESISEKISRAFAVGKVRWGMLALVFFATTLNYIDRATLGIMQPVLAKAMHWTALDYANINFWFQAGYAGGYALQGRVMDKIGVKKGFALAVFFWSLAVAAHGLVASVAGFMICRFLLGFAEAGNYPGCAKTTRMWFPAGERGMATGIFNAGTNVGGMITPVLIPFIMGIWGWQGSFFAIGALGFVWLAVWLKTYHDPKDHPTVQQGELNYINSCVEPEVAKVPYSRVFRMRATWTYIVAYAITAPIFWFYLYWLPPFLNKQYNLGISVSKMGVSLLVIYLMADIGAVAGGALSSLMIGRGMAVIPARMLAMFICALSVIPIVFSASANGLWLAVAYISVGVAAHQAWNTNIWGLVLDMVPKEAIGSVFGLGGTIAAIGGMFMTQLVGYVLTATNNNYSVLFFGIPCIYLIGMAWVWFMAPRQVERI